MKVSLTKVPGLKLSVHLDAQGQMVALSINTAAKAVTVEERPLKGRSTGAVAGTLLSLGGGAKLGAAARNKNMTPERRHEVALKAAQARWGKPKGKKK